VVGIQVFPGDGFIRPVDLGRAVATLDHLCEGKFVLGVGAGWNIEEMQNHGVDPSQRWSHVADHVHAMQTIWTEDVATYHGPFVNFDRIWSWPKPYRHRHVPVLVGGSAKNFSRILHWADGWIPALDGDVDLLVTEINQLRALAAERRPDFDPDITVAVGYGRDLTAAEFEKLRAAQVTRILLAIKPASYEETIAALDQAASIAI